MAVQRCELCGYNLQTYSSCSKHNTSAHDEYKRPTISFKGILSQINQGISARAALVLTILMKPRGWLQPDENLKYK